MSSVYTRYWKKKNAGGTTSRHIQRLTAFGGGYTLALAAGLTLCEEDYELAHKLALALVAGSEDPQVPVGELLPGGIEYVSHSGKRYLLLFPHYTCVGAEFLSPADSSLAGEFTRIAGYNPHCGEEEVASDYRVERVSE